MQAGIPKLSSTLEGLIAKGLLERLPATFSAFWYEQFRDWDTRFPAERDYYERLFRLLDRADSGALEQLFGPLRAVEARMGVNEETWPRRQFTLEQIDFLNRNPHYAEWRAAIAEIFGRIDPVLDEETARQGRRRLVVVVAPAELPMGPDRMWTRLREQGSAVEVASPADPEEYLALLLTGRGRGAQAPDLAEEYAGRAGAARYEAWVVETGSKLRGGAARASAAVHCSYDGLAAYRRRLGVEVDRLVRQGRIRGPRELGEALKRLKLAPGEDAAASDAVLAEFVRATLLSGNGTLLINNTFVEWACAQAARRARPGLVVAGFGIRNKLKPFTGLLMFADQEQANAIPTQADVLGSYVDLEMLYRYVWLQFEKYPEYRGNTAYVFAADGMEQMRVIAPEGFREALPRGAARLEAIHGVMREWLGLG